MKKIILAALLALLVLACLAACAKDDGKKDSGENATTEAATTAEPTTEAITYQVPEGAKDVIKPGQFEAGAINAEGLVGIAGTEGVHSEKFTVEKKGTKVEFTLPKAEVPESKYFAFTTYTKSGEQYSVDLDNSYAFSNEPVSKLGYTYTITENGDALVFTLITAADNQIVCVSALKDTPVFVYDANCLIDVTWNMGYIGSDQHSASKVNQISSGSRFYMYSDVITVPKAGTKIWVSTPPEDVCGDFNLVWAVSHWKDEGGKWVFDTAGYACAGCKPTEVTDVAVVDESGRTLVCYTTTADNETIRLAISVKTIDTTAKLKAAVYDTFAIAP